MNNHLVRTPTSNVQQSPPARPARRFCAGRRSLGLGLVVLGLLAACRSGESEPVAENAAAVVGTGGAPACDLASAGPVQCTLIPGEQLRIDVLGQTLTLDGAFQPVVQGGATVPGKYTAPSGGIGLQTPAGELAFPGGGAVTVTCDPYLAIEGTLGDFPDFAGVGALGSLSASASQEVSLGLALGRQLQDLDLPLGACRPYFTFAASGGAQATFDDAIVGSAGARLALAFDPTDPAFVASVEADDPVSELARVDLGGSLGGHLTWTSPIDLPLGPGSSGTERPSLDAHVYVRTASAIIPVEAPFDVVVDGSVFLDLGASPSALPAASAALLRNDWSDPALAGVLASSSFAATANSIKFQAGSLSLNLGNGALIRTGGVVRFAGEARNGPAALLGSSPLGDLVAKLTFRDTAQVSGYFDHQNGALHYRFSITGDMGYGPLQLDGAKVTIDSATGVHLDLPTLSFDLSDFADLVQCSGSGTGASCTVAGFPVGSISVSNGHVQAAIDLPGVSGSLQYGGGVFTGTLDTGLVNGLSGTVSVSKTGATVSAKLTTFDANIAVSGSLWTGPNHEALFRLQGSGGKAFFPTGPQFATTLRIANVDPAGNKVAVWATVDAQVTPSALASALQTSSAVALHGDLVLGTGTSVPRYTLTGSADLGVSSYKVAGAGFVLSNTSGTTTLTLSGGLQTSAGKLIVVSGHADPSGFVLSGSAAVRIPAVETVADFLRTEIVSGTKSGWNCTATSLSCGFDTFTSGVTSSADCLGSISTCGCELKDPFTQHCIIPKLCCTWTEPKTDCHACTIKVSQTTVYLGDAKATANVTLSGTPQVPFKISTSLSVSNTFCLNGKCNTKTGTNAHIDVAHWKACVDLPVSTLLSNMAAALGVPLDALIDASDVDPTTCAAI